MLSKYVVEDNIDFFKELNQPFNLTNGMIVTEELCSITGDPLDETFITLQCGHKFNYDALFKDVYQQKLKTNDNEKTRVHIKCIQCPYCRSIHLQLLPHLQNTPKI